MRLFTKLITLYHTSLTAIAYVTKYRKYAFADLHCSEYEQFEASITRLYHTIEKGLSYNDYRPGFGRENIDKLLSSMEQYSKKYDIDAMFYRTAISTLYAYLEKNKAYGLNDSMIEYRINCLPGSPNNLGGTITVVAPGINVNEMCYSEMMMTRHSIRHFLDSPVELYKIEKALEIAQYTPSACNRQGWNVYIVQDKQKLNEVLKNQNGNRGFREEIDKLLLVTFDLRYSNEDREVFQAYIDGGMYSANIINALYSEGIGSIPLSASLSKKQERKVRKIVKVKESEVFILFVGVGNYPDNCLTTRSERRKYRYTLV